MLTDSHCHLGQFHDASALLQAVRTTGPRMVVATESPDEYRRLLSRLRGADPVVVGLGLHPLGRAAREAGQLSRFFRFLPDAQWISEVGLDFSAGVDRASKRSQVNLFESILSHALIRTKVLSVHSRSASGEVISRLRAAGVPAVLHWFSGSLADLEDAVDAGLYFSLNEPMLSSRRARAIVSRIPIERVLLETDGPYAKGTNSAGLALRSLRMSARRLAELLDLTATQVETRLEENFLSLTSGSTPLQ